VNSIGLEPACEELNNHWGTILGEKVMANRFLLSVAWIVGLAALPAVTHAAIIPVNCAGGQKIAAALTQAVDGDTIAVSGVCRENITVVRDGITIAKDAAAAGAGIIGQVEVVGRRAVLSLLSIVGPEPPLPAGRSLNAGVWARDGASVFLDRSLIANHTVDGIFANRNASVTTDRVRVLNNTRDCVAAVAGATIRLDTQRPRLKDRAWRRSSLATGDAACSPRAAVRSRSAVLT
jgi:hypothetical protein